MNSFRWRIAGWFTLSLLVVLGMFVAVTYLHLQHELRIERWEREHPGHSDWTLHGSYSASEVDDIAGELGRLSALYALPVAVLALGLGYFLATRTLGPLADLNRQLQAIGADNLKARVRLTRADREFSELEANINGLLGRLERSFLQLTEYSAQVAHELRSPLTLLRLQVEEASDKIEPALAETLQEELGRLADYVDRCLLLARAEQGRLAPHPEVVPLRSLIADLVEAYSLWARAEHRAVAFDNGPECEVVADRPLLRQILHALLTNAIQHGTGSVHITLTRSEDGPCCRIENASTEGTRTARTPGNGMGLRLARALAKSQAIDVVTHAGREAFVAELRWSRTSTPEPASTPGPVLPGPS